MKTIAQLLNWDFKKGSLHLFDNNRNEVYYENSDGGWEKREYDENRNRRYYENSNGTIIDDRPKETILTMDEIAEKFNINVKHLKIKK